MRTDVKLGLAASVLVVVFAGWYFVSNRGKETPIAFDEQKLALAKPSPADAKPNPTDAKAKPSDAKSNTPSQQVNQQGKRPAPAAGQTQPPKTLPNRPVQNPPTRGAAEQPTTAARPTVPQPDANRPPPQAEPVRTPPQTEPARTVQNIPQPPAVTPDKTTADKPADSSMIADLVKPQEDQTSRTLAENDKPTTSTPPVAPPKTDPKPIVSTPPPAATPQVVKQPERPRMETHTVRAGDTLQSLAKAYYGDQRYVKVLQDANPQVTNGASLAVGGVINIPDAPDGPPPTDAQASTAGAAKTANATQPPAGDATGRTHKVVNGDTLYEIAQSTLSQGSRWKEIYELNKDRIGKDPAALKVGQVLKLPAK